MATRRLSLMGGSVTAAAAVAAAALGVSPADGGRVHAETRQCAWDDVTAAPAPRAAQLAQLRRGGFDVLVIGGAPCGALAR